MANVMVSKPGFMFAQSMAARSEPAPVSLVLTTTRLQPAGVTSALALNSDVLLGALRAVESVAVATILLPVITVAAGVNVNVFEPAAKSAAV